MCLSYSTKISYMLFMCTLFSILNHMHDGSLRTKLLMHSTCAPLSTTVYPSKVLSNIGVLKTIERKLARSIFSAI